MDQSQAVGTGLVKRVRWGRVGIYLALTFALTWGFHLLVDRTIGQIAYLETGVPTLGMLLPAVVALLLQMFVWSDSPLYLRNHADDIGPTIWGYLGLTVICGAVTVFLLLVDSQSGILRAVANIPVVLWTMLVLYDYSRRGEEGFSSLGLALGDVDRGSRLVLGTAGFVLLQAGLNLAFGLGAFRGWQGCVVGISLSGWVFGATLVVLLLIRIVGTPLAGLATTFGEEYGWRGYLQSELMPWGRRRAALLIGLVWGIWHVPIVLSGAHTYPATLLGVGLSIVFFALWGIIQSYAVLKTGSVWVGAFLHGLVNSVYQFTIASVVRPDDRLLSFGLGVYGLAGLAVVVFLVLRDQVWDDGGHQEEPIATPTGQAA